ncbi:MAG: galactokinase [Cyanosarcina radialis HA8281-LM2]|jgi:galactokinase|nr:galactokinase [Cyanosarcina radialis HA8281-LM2]
MDFQQIFNAVPDVEASAPGRVNLLGEHTDYNEGFVLPTAIPQQTTVGIGHSLDDRHHFYSANLAESVDVDSLIQPSPRLRLPSPNSPLLTKGGHRGGGRGTGGEGEEGFARYIYGCIRVVENAGHTVPPLNIFVNSAVPIGAGLSSSAALEVATLRGLRSLFNLNLTDVEIARLGQQAEIQYAGVSCGILDQMASSLADREHMLFLDTRTLDRQLLPFPAGAEIIVIDSGVARSLASSGYNQRRAECEEAARQLGVKALRDVKEPHMADSLPALLRQRARHVISENNRVLQVLEGISAEAFGKLMNASHASLRDDYEVSVPALDRLVDILQNTSGVFGARLTGAGFGGASVALVAAGEGKAIAQTVLDRYSSAGDRGRILVG